jgi:hypothetical protein
MGDQNDTRPALLILHADGSVETPGVKTYGELLARLNVCEQMAARIRQQMLGAPLPSAPDAQVTA